VNFFGEKRWWYAGSVLAAAASATRATALGDFEVVMRPPYTQIDEESVGFLWSIPDTFFPLVALAVSFLLLFSHFLAIPKRLDSFDFQGFWEYNAGKITTKSALQGSVLVGFFSFTVRLVLELTAEIRNKSQIP
jgi:hypothetical protein